jgi:hypothetical protein
MTRKKRPKLFLLEEREYHNPSSGIFFKVKNLIYRGRSPYQKIEVIENEHFGRVLLLDGLVQNPNGNLIYLRHRKMAEENTDKPQGLRRIFLFCGQMNKISKKLSIEGGP